VTAALALVLSLEGLVPAPGSGAAIVVWPRPSRPGDRVFAGIGGA